MTHDRKPEASALPPRAPAGAWQEAAAEPETRLLPAEVLGDLIAGERALLQAELTVPYEQTTVDPHPPGGVDHALRLATPTGDTDPGDAEATRIYVVGAGRYTCAEQESPLMAAASIPVALVHDVRAENHERKTGVVLPSRGRGESDAGQPQNAEATRVALGGFCAVPPDLDQPRASTMSMGLPTAHPSAESQVEVAALPARGNLSRRARPLIATAAALVAASIGVTVLRGQDGSTKTARVATLSRQDMPALAAEPTTTHRQPPVAPIAAVSGGAGGTAASEASRPPPTPRQAADWLAGGDYPHALLAYQELAQAKPAEPAYAAVAAALARKVAATCALRSETGMAPCR